MKNGIAEIDHLLTYVPDLDAAARAYERLGFRSSPRSDITAMGIANRLVLLSPLRAGGANFIELMTATDRGRLPGAMRSTLDGAPGVKSMVMLMHDAHAAHAELASNGYAFAPPVHVKREWVIPGEGSVWPEFDVLLPIEAPLAFNAARYHDVSLYLRPDWREHPNGAQALVSVLAVADDVAATAGYYERLFGCRATRLDFGGRSVSPGAVDLQVYPVTGFAERFRVAAPPAGPSGAAYAGFRVRVDDLARTEAVLDEHGVAMRERVFGARRGVVVDPAAASGNVIEFVDDGMRR